MNVAAVAECYDKHAEALVRFAATQVGWSDAQDVVSVAVLGVLQHRGEEIRDLRTYLYQAVANAGARHWRTLERRTRREVAFAPPSPPEVAWSHPRMVAALASLSVQQRAAVHLTYWEDLAVPTVAERLGVSDGTVRKQLARARKRLREVLDEQR